MTASSFVHNFDINIRVRNTFVRMFFHFLFGYAYIYTFIYLYTYTAYSNIHSAFEYFCAFYPI